MLPDGTGALKTGGCHAHDERHGAISSLEALNVATGLVTHDACRQRTAADVLTLAKRIRRVDPAGEGHPRLDNVSTHETPEDPGPRRWMCCQTTGMI